MFYVIIQDFSIEVYNQATFMKLYSQTKQKRLVDQHHTVSVTMVPHGATREGGRDAE